MDGRSARHQSGAELGTLGTGTRLPERLGSRRSAKWDGVSGGDDVQWTHLSSTRAGDVFMVFSPESIDWCGREILRQWHLQHQRGSDMSMSRARFQKISASIASLVALAIVFAANVARADSLSLITSAAALSSNDSVQWSQLGGNGVVLPSSFTANSTSKTVTVSLSGPNSLLSVVCPSSSC